MKNNPPQTRKDKFINEIIKIADDDSHGYSQQPPSGRWGPDFDCSSLIYHAAHNAGYDIDTGSGRVRFTGTMLKDFEKAGFQILPFANVGISDLEIGDILLNLALHAEVYIGEGQTVGATGSETGGYVGEAGDQTGHEIERHPAITFDKDWDYILRPPNDDQSEEIEEGDEEMPMNYGPTPMSNTQPWGNPPSANVMYPQGGGYNPSYNNYNRGTAQIAVGFDGAPLLETTMISQTTAGNLNNVNRVTAVNTCCCTGGAITIINTGTNEITIGANPLLYIRRVA